MKIILPLYIDIPRKTKADKRFYLNLNVFRNAHHQILNQAKVLYTEIVRRIVAWRPAEPLRMPLLLTYTYFPGTAQEADLANVLPIVEKFTDDALIKIGIFADDNYKIVRAVNYRFGGIDRKSPRAELEILRLRGVI